MSVRLLWHSQAIERKADAAAHRHAVVPPCVCSESAQNPNAELPLALARKAKSYLPTDGRKNMIWSGAGLHGTLLAALVVAWITGFDPDESGVKYFLALAPVLFILGSMLLAASFRLQQAWADDEAARGWGFKINRLCAILKCDFSVPPTVFFIPMPLLSVVSVIIAIVIWSGIFK
jgi:hypothetical protein